MIKFFRRIRQRLLSENKVSKYFFYAFGEIVLVVIGILIALSINTWNQNRINKQFEKIALVNLKNDVERQLNDLDATISSEKAISSDLLKIGKYLSDGIHTNNIDSLNKHLSNIMMFRSVNIFDPTFDELKSTGNLNLITNNDLKRNIIEFYQTLGRVDLVLNKNEQTKLHIRDELVNLSFVNVDIISNQWMYDFLSGSGLTVQNPVTDPNRRSEFGLTTLINLMTDQGTLKLNNLVTTRYLSALVSSTVLKTATKSAEGLLKDLHNEILRFDD